MGKQVKQVEGRHVGQCLEKRLCLRLLWVDIPCVAGDGQVQGRDELT